MKFSRGAVLSTTRPIIIAKKDPSLHCFGKVHCIKSVQIRSLFWSAFSCIQTKCGPEKTPYLDIFHAVVQRCKGAISSLVLTTENWIFFLGFLHIFFLCILFPMKFHQELWNKASFNKKKFQWQKRN